MLGPLPRLYRILVAVAAVTVFVAAGAWAAFVVPYPILVTAGASVGLAVGAVCAFVLVHQSHSGPSPRPSRVRRHHRT